jgi:hypothetical protein
VLIDVVLRRRKCQAVVDWAVVAGRGGDADWPPALSVAGDFGPRRGP